MHYLLFYDLADDYLERRGEFRGVHLAYARAAVERGELILGGALADHDSGWAGPMDGVRSFGVAA